MEEKGKAVSNYDKIYDKILYMLQDIDFKDAASRLGFRYIENGSDGEEMEIDFLGNTYTVTHNALYTKDGARVNMNNRSVLIWYAASEGMGEPAYDYCKLTAFSHGIFSDHNRDSSVFKQIGERIGGDYNRFKYAMDTLGATYEGSKKEGEYTYSYMILPKIPTRLTFYEADDEYPCIVDTLWDVNSNRFMPFEAHAVMAGLFMDRIEELANSK